MNIGVDYFTGASTPAILLLESDAEFRRLIFVELSEDLVVLSTHML